MFTHAEIFEKITECDGDEEKIEYTIKRYADSSFTKTLYYLFDPNVEFNINWIPEYIPLDALYGDQFIRFNHIFHKLGNHFILGKNTDYGEDDREKLLKRWLETLHSNDAKLLEMMIKRKKPQIKGFGETYIRKHYPNLLSKENKATLKEFFI